MTYKLLGIVSNLQGIETEISPLPDNLSNICSGNPSCPPSPLPHEYIFPLESNARLWKLPTAIAHILAIFLPKNDIFIGK